MEDNKKKKGLYFFITKPRFAMVISIFITIVGLVSMFGLQLEKYPNITPPQVTVSASYPGASAAVIESSVRRHCYRSRQALYRLCAYRA